MRYEPIQILRASTVTNADGDPVDDAWSEHLHLEGKFAPSNPTEPLQVGRNTVISGGTVYIRDLESRPDITADDRVVIRGSELAIDGEVGAWLRVESWAVQFAVKAAN